MVGFSGPFGAVLETDITVLSNQLGEVQWGRVEDVAVLSVALQWMPEFYVSSYSFALSQDLMRLKKS